MSIRNNLEDNYEALTESGCWIWMRSITTAGYGRLVVDNRIILAHRFIYEKFIGPIPAGFQIDHLSRVRSCINPAHLEPVTPKENKMRGIGVGAINAKKTHCKNGHEFTLENTYPQKRRRVCKICWVTYQKERRALIRAQRMLHEFG
jgi:hypothetical protein